MQLRPRGVTKTVSEAEAAIKGMIENLQRQDLDPIEEAEGFRSLRNLKDDHWSQERIAQIAGKTQDYVSRSLTLLQLSESILESMRQRIITREHCIELIRLNGAKEQKRMALKLDRNGWSVKELRAAVDKRLNPTSPASLPAPSTPTPVNPDPGTAQDPMSPTWQALSPYLKEMCQVAQTAPFKWQLSISLGEGRALMNQPGVTPESAASIFKQNFAAFFIQMAEACGALPQTTPVPDQEEVDEPIKTLEVARSPDGQVVLMWPPIPGATEYVVCFKDGDKEWATCDPVLQTDYTITFGGPQNHDFLFAIRPILERGKPGPMGTAVTLKAQ